MGLEEAPAQLAALQGFLAVALRREAPIAGEAGVAAAAAVHVAGNERLSPAEQADLYREQFWLRHVEALTEDYPGLRALVGEEAFDAFLRAYLRAHPPRTPSLRDLGADVVAFGAAWAGFPDGHRAAAMDLLRYEHAFVDLFDGADPPPLDGRKLAALAEGGWEGARIALHPLLALLRLDHPVHHYRLAVLGLDGALREEAPAFPERRAVCLVLYRRDRVIQFEEVAPGAFALLQALAAGAPLAEACDRASAGLGAEEAEAFAGEVGAWFQRWTALGWIVDVVV